VPEIGFTLASGDKLMQKKSTTSVPDFTKNAIMHDICDLKMASGKADVREKVFIIYVIIARI